MVDNNGNFNSEFQERVDSRDHKAFNKAFLDLRQLSVFEWVSGQARIEKDWELWLNTLQAWLNKLSADIKKKSDLEALDQDLANSEILFQEGNYQQLKIILNSVERKLYRVQKDIGIGNPNKVPEYLSEEKWT